MLIKWMTAFMLLLFVSASPFQTAQAADDGVKWKPVGGGVVGGLIGYYGCKAIGIGSGSGAAIVNGLCASFLAYQGYKLVEDITENDGKKVAALLGLNKDKHNASLSQPWTNENGVRMAVMIIPDQERSGCFTTKYALKKENHVERPLDYNCLLEDGTITTTMLGFDS